MSTALSHLGPVSPALFFGADDSADVFDFAKLLEEAHGPAKAPGPKAIKKLKTGKRHNG